MGKQVVGIMGSYRKGGTIDTVVAEVLRVAQLQGADIAKIDLMVLITSSTAPGLLTKLFARPLKTLKRMARLLGAKPVGTLVVDWVNEPDVHISDKTRQDARRLGIKLAT